jgi:predicted acylesterase/phospholipase RssA
MRYTIKNRDQHLARDGAPKRILALDGGGLRGILSLALLQKIEDTLRQRHGGDADFRLCHYFDLIAGTSTGAIIAATLALGWTVKDLRARYMDLGVSVFERSLRWDVSRGLGVDIMVPAGPERDIVVTEWATMLAEATDGFASLSIGFTWAPLVVALREGCRSVPAEGWGYWRGGNIPARSWR